jgi:competence ComEA-like helix-hairpin-helix protein
MSDVQGPCNWRFRFLAIGAWAVTRGDIPHPRTADLKRYALARPTRTGLVATTWRTGLANSARLARALPLLGVFDASRVLAQQTRAAWADTPMRRIDMIRMKLAAGALALALGGATLPATTIYAAAQDTKTAVATPVNINSATAAELEKLPGIGPAMAARIVDYRQKNGGFKKVEDILET